MPAIDYLALGHVARDLIPGGARLGGTAAFAALTARALGYRPGLVTAAAPDLDLAPLNGLDLALAASPDSTTFENIYGPEGRTQFLRALAAPLRRDSIPAGWEQARLIHLAPLAREFSPALAQDFAGRFVGLTPQGWLREWGADGRVQKSDWPEAAATLPHVNATVLSIEDIRGEWAVAEAWARAARVLVVTQAELGCTVFVRGEGARQFAAAPAEVIDPTGAGDIFAAAFFAHLYETEDAWAAARFANQMGAISVTRAGLAGVPEPEEVALCRIRSM
jgi:sugar/nucleoside kinase (ribokinase family)